MILFIVLKRVYPSYKYTYKYNGLYLGLGRLCPIVDIERPDKQLYNKMMMNIDRIKMSRIIPIRVDIHKYFLNNR